MPEIKLPNVDKIYKYIDIVSIVCIVVGFLILLRCFSSLEFLGGTQNELVLVPEEIIAPSVSKEEENIILDFKIRNKTNRVIQIENIRASCGCTKIQTNDLQEIQFPMEVTSKAVVLMKASIDAYKISKNKTVVVLVFYRGNDGSIKSSSCRIVYQGQLDE